MSDDGQRNGSHDGQTPQAAGTVCPELRRRWLPLARFLARVLYRPRVDGAHNLPNDGPFLLVANHSGVLGIAELLCLATWWLSHRPQQRLAGFAHHRAFDVPALGALLRRLGAVPSTYAAATSTLQQGVPLLVFPGGDHEAFRPIWHADRVDFGGRHGFVRIAARAGVPIVPLGIHGSAWTAPILWRSDGLLPRLWILPHRFGLRRWPLTVLGVLGAVGLVGATLQGGLVLAPWAAGLLAVVWLASPLPLLPWLPVPIRLRFGAPLPMASWPGAAHGEDLVDDPKRLAVVAAAVEAAVQAAVREAGTAARRTHGSDRG